MKLSTKSGLAFELIPNEEMSEIDKILTKV